MNSTAELHVVIGSGPLGLALGRELVARRKWVRMVNRAGFADVPTRIYVFKGDAADAASLREACDGATVIYHCAQPPYAEWPARAPAMMRGVIEAAARAGARLVYGDNLYAYGPVSGPVTEDLPYRARGRHGRTRAQLAVMLMEAHDKGRLAGTIGRAADFYGPFVLRSLVGERVFGRALRGRSAQVIGNPDVPRTYTYIDDFARALVTLGERDEAPGQVWHVPSAETLTTRRFVEMVFEALSAPAHVDALPRVALTLLGAFDPTLRALREVRYQTERPFVMDHGKFQQAFGGEATPHAEAIRHTLDWFRENPD